MAKTHVRPLSADVREKLGKLLPLLSSTHVGEQTAAIAAVGRVLSASGLDWHDFTAAFTTSTPSAPPPRPESPPRQESNSIPSKRLAEVIETLRATRRFDPNSEDFLDSLAANAARYSNVYVSPKQMKWLRDLAHKAGF